MLKANKSDKNKNIKNNNSTYLIQIENWARSTLCIYDPKARFLNLWENYKAHKYRIVLARSFVEKK